MNAACLTSPVGFGLGRLHHVRSSSDRERIILGAIDAGCRHFDVAPAYGDGLCEAEFGRIAKHHRSTLSIATKFGIPCATLGASSPTLYYVSKACRKLFSKKYNWEYSQRDFSPASAVRSLDASLARLRTDYIDYFFLHDPRDTDDLSGLSELIETLEQLKEVGKIRHFGLSTRTSLLLKAIHEGRILGDTSQFELSSQSTELTERLPLGHKAFSFGLMRYLLQQWGDSRLDYVRCLQWFFSQFPDVVPLIATNRLSAITELGSFLRSL